MRSITQALTVPLPLPLPLLLPLPLALAAARTLTRPDYARGGMGSGPRVRVWLSSL